MEMGGGGEIEREREREGERTDRKGGKEIIHVTNMMIIT
jgi:hypothetical protein